MKILCVGDVVGRPGRDAVEKLLPGLKKEFDIECVIVNAENSAGGNGITTKIAKEFFAMGCDVLTMGDHVWDKHEIKDYLNDCPSILRPLNFPEGTPGRGWCVISTASGKKVAVMNLIGRVFMRYNVNCPFKEARAAIDEIKKQTSVIVVDMHAEATSEKVAMGWYLDGHVSLVFGTHTHIPTADETILPNATAYITDLGMTGPYHSVIGQSKEKIIERFLTSLPVRFETATEDSRLSGIVVDVDETTGRAKTITRLQRRLL